MTRFQKLGAVLIAAGLSLIPNFATAAPTVQFVGVGSSAIWQTAGIAAWELTGKANHYTFKLSGTGVGVVDSRNTTSIAPAQGAIWVVWDSAVSKIYAGVNLDSNVGNRLELGTVSVSGASVPTGILVLPATIPAPGALISSTLWGADAASIPTAVVTALSRARVTHGLTDIRPENGAFQTARATAALGATVSDGAHSYYGLGYTGALTPTPSVTNWIESTYSSAAFQVVKFSTHGTDPYTSATIPSFTAFRVGISPIVLIGNRSNTAGLGAKNAGGAYYFTNLTSAQVQALWDGNTDNTSEFAVAGAPSVPLTVVLREFLSGTYNTFEYQAIESPYIAPPAAQHSQESGINPANTGGNPVNITSTNGGGVRKRVIGTGEMVGTAVFGTADAIGYTFFSFGNVSKIANNPTYGYFKVNGVDPLLPNYATNGLLPVTGQYTISQLFSNVASGAYPLWSDLRIVTYNYGAPGSPTQSNTTTAAALVTQIQTDINAGTQFPDFIPFAAATIYRSHYANGTYTNGAASNGLGSATENGGDVDGTIEPCGTTFAAQTKCSTVTGAGILNARN